MKRERAGKVQAPPPDLLYENETQRLLEVASHDPRTYMLVMLLLETGIKKAELLELTTDNFDFSNKYQPEVWIKHSGKLAYKGRRLKLPGQIAQVFDDYTQQHGISGLLFPYTPRFLEQLLAEAARNAKITKKVSAGVLRDMFVVRSVKQGMKLEEAFAKIGLSRSSYDDARKKYGRLTSEALWMNHGTKISKPGHSVGDPDAEAKPGNHSKQTIAEMITGPGLSFLFGAAEQVKRHSKAYSFMEKSPIVGVTKCLHEALNLLEDLDTLSHYTQRCGETHTLNDTIRNMRNHARHDIRENIDRVDGPRRVKRASALGIHQDLLVSIGFDKDAIKMGTTVLTLKEVNDYISWASGVLTKTIEQGVRAGRIKGPTIVNGEGVDGQAPSN